MFRKILGSGRLVKKRKKTNAGLEFQGGHGGHGLRGPCLGLSALSKIPIDFKIFQWTCPFQNENGLALPKMKFQAC